jgi:RNA polymerase sigma-70 factor (ECF subfamily)
LIANPEVQVWSDEEIVGRVLAGEPALFEILMRRHNQRIYRIVRGVLDDDGETEDVMQDAYVRAYQHLGQFEAVLRLSPGLRESRCTKHLRERGGSSDKPASMPARFLQT